MNASRDEKFEIAHVLFVDLVAYSKLLLTEQSAALKELNEVVKSGARFRDAESAGSLLQLPTGDGMALIFRDSPEAPAECAMEIAQALRAYPNLKVRMGLHSGPVKYLEDVTGRSNIAGAGVNLAQRVMDCGDAGHILLSKHLAEDLEHHPRWAALLHDLGETTGKHDVVLHLVSLYDANLGNPLLPTKLRLERKGRTRRQQRRFLWSTVALALLAALVTGYFLTKPRPQRDPPAPPDDKSIAVLPFENLSAAPENAFLADGIQDDLLNSLARIKDLRVISRTSVMAYRNRTRNLREIGSALNVANILEGSVRREKDRVAVNCQLIDARHDRQLWANRYDRTIQDSLGLEGALAAEIAEALRATLTPEEKARVVQQPTQNAQAWILYLRALPLALSADNLLRDYRTAADLFSQAIALDPNFALAHARLASVYTDVFHYYEPTAVWKARSRAEAETALRLQPDLSEAHFALGQYFYVVENDYAHALDEFSQAQQLAPNDANVAVRIAAIRRRQGRWPEALAGFEAIEKLDPRNPTVVRNVMFTNAAMRRWAEAERAGERLLAVAGTQSLISRIQVGYVTFQAHGNLEPLKKSLAEMMEDPDGAVTACRWEAAMIERDFARARTVMSDSPLTETSYYNAGMQPKELFIAFADLAAGRDASEEFAHAVVPLEAAVRESPDAAERHCTLGLAYAFMGRHDDAIREGKRAVELKPETKDAYDGALMNCSLALIYARVGEKESALSLIALLLHTPGAVDSVNYSVTLNDLRYRWEWDPIRDDPRFQQLIKPDATSAR